MGIQECVTVCSLSFIGSLFFRGIYCKRVRFHNNTDRSHFESAQ